MKDDKELSRKVLYMMHAEGPDSKARIDEQHWGYCRFGNAVFGEFFECNGHSGNFLDYMFSTWNFVFGPWYEVQDNPDYL